MVILAKWQARLGATAGAVLLFPGALLLRIRMAIVHHTREPEVVMQSVESPHPPETPDTDLASAVRDKQRAEVAPPALMPFNNFIDGRPQDIPHQGESWVQGTPLVLMHSLSSEPATS